MKKYIVSAQATISVFTEVSAANEAEALRIASERSMPGLCFQCATGSPRDEWATSGELDGEPEKLSVEEA